MLAAVSSYKPKSLVAALMVTSALVLPVFAGVPSAAAQEQTADEQYQFHIETTSLAAGISQIGKTSGWRIAYTFGLPTLAEKASIRGAYTVPDALDSLLAGTGLTYRLIAEKSIVLVDPAASEGTETSDGAATLPAIDVIGQRSGPNSTIDNLPLAYAGNMVAEGGRVGMLGNKDVMDTPFNITSYTGEKVENQQATTVADVVKSDPSVRVSSSSGGLLDAYYIRGFPLNIGNSSEIAFNGVFGVTPNYRIMSDLAERVEVVKGPTALIYGMAPNSGVGGTINIVPKRAGEEDLNKLRASYGRGNQAGLHADVSRRLGDGQEFGIRVNGSYSDGDTALDNQTRTAALGAVALDYKGDRFRATLDLISQEENINAPAREIMVASGVAIPSAPNGARNVTQEWEWSDIEDRTALLQAEYDVTDQVMLFAGFGGGNSQVHRLFGNPVIQNSNGDTLHTPTRFTFDVDRWSGDAGMRAEFETGAVDHNLTLQANIYDDTLHRGSRSGTQISSNIYNPITQSAQSVAAPSNVVKTSETQMTGLALADTLSAWDELVQFTAGLRLQHVQTDNFDSTGAPSNSYDDDALSPMAGLVVKPWDNISLYANYIEGLSKGEIAPNTASNAGQALAPYVTEQYEAGVKMDFGAITTTVSAFQITQPDGQLVGNVFTDNGEQRNRGLEFNIYGEITPDIRIMAGAMVLDAELTSTGDASTEGNTPVGVPEFQANLTAEWDTPFLDGLTLAGSVIHTGSQYVNNANTNSISDWTTFDLAAYYTTEIADNPVTVRGTVENVFDHEYWSGVNSWSMVSLGAPRTFFVSVASEF